MRLAAIDLGTNSTKMTVADATDGTLAVVQEASEVTRLGEGVDASGALSEDARARTLAVVSRFAAEARALGAEEIVCAGTSALRDASNGPQFIARVREETGLSLEIITGEREARLAYGAVVSDASLGVPPGYALLVFDIGGGSTELILGGAGGMERRLSLDMGAVRVTERFLHSDPPSAPQIEDAKAFIQAQLDTFAVPEARPIIVGIGGTAVNIGAVTVGGQASAPDSVHAVLLTDSDVDKALTRFQGVPLAERRHIPGLEPKRADVIIGGALILQSLLRHVDSDRFLISARGLRYGLLAERAARPAP